MGNLAMHAAFMQVEGARGFPHLLEKVRVGGPTVLYHGALAASAATFVGHYPWFATVSRDQRGFVLKERGMPVSRFLQSHL
jgi:hypothetical protein